MSRTRHSHRSEVSLADDKQLPSFLLVLIRDWKGWRCTENLLSFFPKASKTQKNPHRGLNRPDSRPGVNPLPRGRWPWLEATGCEGRTIPQPLALGCVQLWLSVHQEVPTLPGEAATPPPSPALGPWPGSQGHLATEVPARKNLTRKLQSLHVTDGKSLGPLRRGSGSTGWTPHVDPDLRGLLWLTLGVLRSYFDPCFHPACPGLIRLRKVKVIRETCSVTQLRTLDKWPVL